MSGLTRVTALRSPSRPRHGMLRRMERLYILLACIIGGAAAVGLHVGGERIFRSRAARIEERRQAGDLPANDNYRPSPAARKRAMDEAARHMADRLSRSGTDDPLSELAEIVRKAPSRDAH